MKRRRVKKYVGEEGQGEKKRRRIKLWRSRERDEQEVQKGLEEDAKEFNQNEIFTQICAQKKMNILEKKCCQNEEEAHFYSNA